MSLTSVLSLAGLLYLVNLLMQASAVPTSEPPVGVQVTDNTNADNTRPPAAVDMFDVTPLDHTSSDVPSSANVHDNSDVFPSTSSGDQTTISYSDLPDSQEIVETISESSTPQDTYNTTFNVYRSQPYVANSTTTQRANHNLALNITQPHPLDRHEGSLDWEDNSLRSAVIVIGIVAGLAILGVIALTWCLMTLKRKQKRGNTEVWSYINTNQTVSDDAKWSEIRRHSVSQGLEYVPQAGATSPVWEDTSVEYANTSWTSKQTRPERMFPERICKEPMCQEPMCQERMYQEPMCHEQMFQEATCQEPVCQERMCHEQIHQEPMCQKRMCQEEIRQEPVCQEPMCQKRGYLRVEIDSVVPSSHVTDNHGGYANFNDSPIHLNQLEEIDVYKTPREAPGPIPT